MFKTHNLVRKFLYPNFKKTLLTKSKYHDMHTNQKWFSTRKRLNVSREARVIWHICFEASQVQSVNSSLLRSGLIVENMHHFSLFKIAWKCSGVSFFEPLVCRVFFGEL